MLRLARLDPEMRRKIREVGEYGDVGRLRPGRREASNMARLKFGMSETTMSGLVRANGGAAGSPSTGGSSG
jgi:hypothetical protein